VSTLVRIPVAEVTPAAEQILSAMGMTLQAASGRHRRLVEEAVALFTERAEPVGMWSPVNLDEFAAVYRGASDGFTPLSQIYPRAHTLALFAVTLGERVRDEIDARFQKADFALGAALDAAASEGAELAASELEVAYTDGLRKSGSLDQGMGVMRFSPGYCGWHTNGQQGLFAHLRPDEIGITLSPSCLMHPLKSVSGVFVAAPRRAFVFADDFPFCSDCQTRSCRERIAAVLSGWSDSPDQRERL
jgi:hypothetical protein